MGHNPFAPPACDVGFVEGVDGIDDAERVRRALLRHEGAIRGVGILYYLATGIFAVMALVSSIHVLDTAPYLTLLYAALGAAMFYVGRGLRRYEPWSRPPAMVFAVLGLLNFPVGTIINAYILYLVGGANGRRVLSREYQELVRQTPHIRPPVSGLVVAVLLLFGSVFGLFVWRALPS